MIFKSFDGSVVKNCKLKSVNKRDKKIFTNKKMIPMGANLSYSQAAFGPHIKSILYDDKKKIVLSEDKKKIIVSSNVRLYEIFNFLYPKNKYLKIQPGISAVSVGGCIASNIHGKNQFRDGNFESIVCSMKLIDCNNHLKTLSRKTNKQLFYDTIGGFGITGLILEAELIVSDLNSDYLIFNKKKLNNLYDLKKEFINVKNYDFVYSWHMPNKKNKIFGQGFLFYGNFTRNKIKSTKKIMLKKPVIFSSKLPFTFYSFIIVKIINKLFYFKNLLSVNSKNIRIDKIFFPLNNSMLYFSLFSKSGFYEYQTVIPLKNYNDFVTDFVNLFQIKKPTITLISAKFFKKHNPRNLNFDASGICLAINLPKSPRSLSFMNDLDDLNIKFGCTPNLIKDSRISKSVTKILFANNYITFSKLVNRNRKFISSSFLNRIFT